MICLLSHWAEHAPNGLRMRSILVEQPICGFPPKRES
jgi:hypothetical protein